MNGKSVKITKRSRGYRGYASTYNEILNIFNPELQRKDICIKHKLINLLSKLRGFKFEAILGLEFKKYKMMMKQNLPLFILTKRHKQLFVKVILMTYLNQFILRLYRTYKNILEKVLIGLLIKL